MKAGNRFSIATDAAPTHPSDSTLFQLSSGLQVLNLILAASCLVVNQLQSRFDERKRKRKSQNSFYINYEEPLMLGRDQSPPTAILMYRLQHRPRSRPPSSTLQLG